MTAPRSRWRRTRFRVERALVGSVIAVIAMVVDRYLRRAAKQSAADVQAA